MRPHDACPRPRLTFAALAWVKLQFFCHAGDTEIAGFGVAAKNNLLYVEDFITVRQYASSMTVKMDDHAIADFTDRCVDAGLPPQRFLRIWCHTHPGASPMPSGTDEETFARAFGTCDWAVMFIVSRTASTYARLSFHTGPGMEVNMHVSVDWSAWPEVLNDLDTPFASRLVKWQSEFAAHIQPFPQAPPKLPSLSAELPRLGRAWGPVPEAWGLTDLEQQLWEENELNEHFIHDDGRP